MPDLNGIYYLLNLKRMFPWGIKNGSLDIKKDTQFPIWDVFDSPWDKELAEESPFFTLKIKPTVLEILAEKGK